MSHERETTIVYSHAFEIKKEDPGLIKLRERWKEAFGGEVKIDIVDNRLIVKKDDKVELYCPVI